MTTAHRDAWRGDWTAREPVRIGFAWAPKHGGEWARDAASGFEMRDLGVAEASGGALGVRHLRVGPVAPSEDWRAHDVDFDFLFVLAGSATLANEDGERVELTAGSAAGHAPLLRHRLSAISPDFDAVHVTAPAVFATFAGADAVRPERELGAPPRAVYTHETPENYERGAGPRKFFSYRMMGTRELSGDRIHIHVVRAGAPSAEGTGWHYHTMAQWFMIVGGSSSIAVEDRPVQPLVVGDAMCVGYGPTMRHNVAPFTADYAVLEMCVPAEYDTIAVDAPSRT